MQTLPRGYKLTDASDTPKVSPIASDTTAVALKAPKGAGLLTVTALDHDAVLNEAGGSGTFTMPQDVPFDIPCKPGDIITIDRSGGATVLEFAFEIH